MKVAVYSTKSYDRKYLELINAKYGLELEFYDFMLSERTASVKPSATHWYSLTRSTTDCTKAPPKARAKNTGRARERAHGSAPSR